MSEHYIRKAFLMSVRDDCHIEYERRHSEIWPELLKVLKQHGARNYSIFLDANTSQLFAYIEIKNEKIWQTMADTDVCKKWWEYMKNIMETNRDNSPTIKELQSVFFMQ